METDGKKLVVMPKEDRGMEIVSNVSVMDKLLSAAANGMDMAAIEKFMDLAERNEKNEAKRAFNKAFAAFKADAPGIKKDKKVNVKFKEGGGMSYEHASIGNVVSSIVSRMSEFGLSHSWFLNQNGNNITVTCRITHEQGHHEETGMTAGADVSGKKNSIQAIASTITYLERYTIQAATGIAVLERDDDGHAHQAPVVDAAYWCNKLDKEAPRNLGGIKTWKAKNIKEISKMPEGQEKTDTLAYIEDMIKEYAPAKQATTDKKPVDRTMVEKCLVYLKSVSSSLDEFMSGWNEHIKNNLKGLPVDQQKELTDLKETIETKFQGDAK